MSASSAPLTTFALVCTLKAPPAPSSSELMATPAPSSSELMATQILARLATHDISGEVVRVVDHWIKPGVELNTGTDDDWPSVRAKMMSANM